MIQISETGIKELNTSLGIAIILSVSYGLWKLIFLKMYKIGSTVTSTYI